MKPTKLLSFCILSTVLVLAVGLGYQDYSCTGTCTAGVLPDVAKTYQGPDTNLGFNYVAEDPTYTFKFCGVVTEWTVLAGNEGTLQLQVWRRLSNTDYQMIGENYCIITSGDIDNVKTCAVDVQDRIIVQKGDFMGWHSNGEELLKYEVEHYQNDNLSGMFRREKPISASGTGDLHPGDHYGWNSANVYNDRDYAIQATYVTSSLPVVTPLQSSITLPDYNISSATITRITYSDPDVADNNTLSKYALESAPYFTLDLNSGFVMADSSYPFRPRASQIGLAVYDTCYNRASATISFTVDEKKLTLTSLPASFTLSENQTSQSLLHTITWTDAANDPVYCRYGGSDPFFLQPISTTAYGLYVSDFPEFNFALTPTYSLTITCYETQLHTTESTDGVVTIYITENLAPSITNLDASATVDAETAKIGDVVYTVSTSDPEGDAISFAATCDPAVDCPLEIRQTGEIQINNGLLFRQSHYYSLEITITDSHNNQDGPNYFLLTIENINNDAEFTNLPLSTTLEVMENTPVDTPLYTILYRDRDIADTKIMTVTYSDDRLSRLFNLDPSTGVLSTAFNEIDYEAFTHPTTYVLTIALGDTKSDITKTINIEFINQNEPPRFTKDYFDITIEEGNDGVELTNGNIFTTNFVDEDLSEVLNGESHIFSFDCENGSQTHRFYLNPTTARMTFAGPYDLDTAGTPDEVSCVITITDKYGLSDTADIYIHVTNVNEFNPEFSKTHYTIYVQPDTLVGTSVLTVSADDLDADLDTDKEFYYSLDQTPLGAEYFHVDQQGRVYLVASLLSFSLGQSLSPFTVIVSNPSTPVKSGTAIIQTVIPSSTTTAAGTTTDRNKGFYEDYYNLIWLILVLGGFIIILLAISVVMFQVMRLQIIPIWCRVCCTNCKEACCKPKPDPERGFGDRGYDLTSFGHEHKYTDDDDIDGWIRRQGPKEPKQSGYQRFGVQPDNSKQVIRKEPVYEMFRVPTPTNQDRLDRTGPKITWKRGKRF